MATSARDHFGLATEPLLNAEWNQGIELNGLIADIFVQPIYWLQTTVTDPVTGTPSTTCEEIPFTSIPEQHIVTAFGPISFNSLLQANLEFSTVAHNPDTQEASGVHLKFTQQGVSYIPYAQVEIKFP